MSTPNFEIGSPDKDLYLKAGGVPYLKLTTAGVLTPINSGSISGTTITNASLVAAGIGAWTAVVFNAADYTGNGTLVWTVAAGDQSASPIMWARIGNVLFANINIVTTTVSGVGTALQIPIPGGFSPVGGNNSGSYHYKDATTFDTGVWTATATLIQFLKRDFTSNWSAATDTTEIRGQIVLHIS